MSEPAALSPRAQRIEAQRLRVTSTDAVWNARLRASVLALAESNSAGDEFALSRAEAALLIGEFQLARKLIEAAREHSSYPRLIALYSRWAGDLGFLKKEWPFVMKAVHSVGAAYFDLVVAAEAIGAAEDAAFLKSAPPRAVPTRTSDRRDPFMPVFDLIDQLGVEPDAPRGRLGLKLSLPESWDALTLERLRVGDNELNCALRRSADAHHFHFEPLSGATPLRLILELVIPGTRISAIEVDDISAQLDVRAAAPGLLSCPIQIVLDHERTIEISAA